MNVEDAALAEGERRRRPKAPPKQPLKRRSYAEMLAPNLDTRSLVKGLLETSAIALIFGESGCGKTFFTLDLALHIAAGSEWFGRRVTKGRVVYVAAEAGRSIQNRVAAWAMEKGKGQPEIDFSAVISPVDLCHLGKGDDVDRLVEVIVAADVIVIDTVSRALAGGNENGPDDMGAFVTALDRLREKLGCTIVAVHHVGKDASRGGRGHSLLHCAVDSEIEVERRDDGVCTATLLKQRDGPAGAVIAFLLKQVVLGMDQDEDDVTTCVIESTEYVAEAKGATGQPKMALAVLNQVVAEKGEFIPCGSSFEIRAVKVTLWEEYLKRSLVLGEGASFRQAWRRVQGKLHEGGHVNFQNGFVWPTKPAAELP